MLTLKPFLQYGIRILLIAVVLLNAMVPTAAFAMVLPTSQSADQSPAIVEIASAKGSSLTNLLFSFLTFQDGTPASSETPVDTPTQAETTTPQPSLTSTLEVAPAVTEVTSTPSPAFDGTPTLSSTSRPSQTTAASQSSSVLS